MIHENISARISELMDELKTFENLEIIIEAYENAIFKIEKECSELLNKQIEFIKSTDKRGIVFSNFNSYTLLSDYDDDLYSLIAKLKGCYKLLNKTENHLFLVK